MKRLVLSILCLIVLTATAQPPKRQAEQAQQKAQTAATQRAQTAPRGVSYREFPVAQDMPEDAAWRRDIYRVLNLKKDRNASLYYPVTPTAGRVNLFTYLMKLLLRRQIKAYEYPLDDTPDFSPEREWTAKKIMDANNILYTTDGGRMRVNDVDLSLPNILRYYVKESVFYDQHTATFHTRVVALAPVKVSGDTEYGEDEQAYPICWFKYSDIAPHLSKLMLMESNLNNAAVISADDYFTTNQYEGDIYKTTNMQDAMLKDVARQSESEAAADSLVKAEQQKIEQQLTDFRQHVWGEEVAPAAAAPAEPAAADSVQAETPKAPAARQRRQASTRRTTASSSRRTTQKEPRQRSSKPRSSGGKASFSVRKERH